jgi:hypothetical protein
MASREVALLSRAQRALAQARTVDDFKDVRDMAEVARGFARRKKVARDVQLELACLTIQAEHGLGTALSQMHLAKGRRKGFQTGTGSKLLKDLGLTKQESHRAQILAGVPKEKLECWLAARCAEGKEPTLAAAREYALELAGRKLRVVQPAVGRLAPIDVLAELLEHQKMLSELLSRVYDGGSVEFEPVEGRLIWRLTNEIGELARQLAKSRGHR